MSDKSTRLHIILPDELIKEIEAYQEENYIRSRSGAIIQLIQQSLRENKS